MRLPRLAVLAVLFIAALAGGWFATHRTTGSVGEAIDVYYAKPDGVTLVPWRVTLGPARDRKSAAFYAATQCVAGPPPGTDATRFPPGTRVLGASVEGSTVVVDLSRDVEASAAGGFTESAEFRSLVWTLTQRALGFTAVRVLIGGRTVATLPGGHLELDEPLSRSSF